MVNTWFFTRARWVYLAGIFAVLPIITQAQTVASPVAEEAGPPDEIVLKDGSRILGEVTGARDGSVTIETGFAGKLKVAIDKIEALHSRDPQVVQLVDDTVLRDVSLAIEGERLLVASDPGPPHDYALDMLKRINPEPWELGEAYKWDGRANLALVLQRGNTDTDELDYKLESFWTSTRDRYTLKWRGENDEAIGEKKANNWQVATKYDYFLTYPNYWGVQAFAQRDRFADLQLRYLVGPYIGRQFYFEPLITVFGELGVAYVNEDFIIAEDRNHPAVNWSLNATSNYLGGDSKLYVDQTGIWNLDETADVIIDTTLGLAFPLLDSLEAAAELLLEYDSGAMGEVDTVDQTYKFRIGYTW